MLHIFLMFQIFLVSSWDISHSQFGIQNQILVSRGYRDTANFRRWMMLSCMDNHLVFLYGILVYKMTKGPCQM